MCLESNKGEGEGSAVREKEMGRLGEGARPQERPSGSSRAAVAEPIRAQVLSV
jgi:hypothetical protein